MRSEGVRGNTVTAAPGTMAGQRCTRCAAPAGRACRSRSQRMGAPCTIEDAPHEDQLRLGFSMKQIWSEPS
jgi:hypothetical protein